MNTELEPPRVPPLTPAERSRLRNQVMDRSRPTEHRPGRRWLAPAIAVGAVAAVVTGTLVVTQKSPDDAGVAGTSAGPASPEAKVGVLFGHSLPDPVQNGVQMVMIVPKQVVDRWRHGPR